jgi:hypothetical protein
VAIRAAPPRIPATISQSGDLVINRPAPPSQSPINIYVPSTICLSRNTRGC